MRIARVPPVVGALVLLGGAPAAPARVTADAAAAPGGKFALKRMSTARSVHQGSTLVVRGRVTNTRGRASTARVTFSLRQAKRVRRLRAKGTRADRNRGQNILVTKPGELPVAQAARPPPPWGEAHAVGAGCSRHGWEHRRAGRSRRLGWDRRRGPPEPPRAADRR